MTHMVATSQWRVLEVEGDLDLVSAPDLRARLGGLSQGAPAYLVLDLSALQFVDSTGLGVLVGTHRRVRAAGGEVRIAGVSPRILRVLSVTGLDQVFSLFPTVAEALDSLPEECPSA